MTTVERIRPVAIEDEMRSSYLDYAMSVIVARALPDARDGLKPVQRRILYAMDELNLGPTSPYKKSARIVGEVLGKYHPHGDAPVYEALVRLAQDFTMRYPLVDGQGNFGSVDDDPPAAMRYTEARLSPIATEMLADIDLETVDFVDNFDGTLREPVVLPARLPNLLVNGASGIAVGMATNVPPHNLSEICDAVVLLIDKPDTTVEELLEVVKGPDFPTGGIILAGKDKADLLNAYATGHGRVIQQARVEVEETRGGRRQIVVHELPYQVNKAALVERIAVLARDKKIEGIADVRDESGRQGLRVVIELKKDVPAQPVLNNLYKHTALQSAFYINMLALVDGQPQVLGLRQALHLYISHRQQVVRRRSEHLLKKARERAHILEGLRIALNFLDEVISIIRNAPDVDAARKGLMERLNLSEVQAQAILDMQLRRLAALERQKLEEEYQGLLKTIAELEGILSDASKLMAVVRDETLKLKERFGDARRTEVRSEEVKEFSVEESILHEDVVIMLTQRGYIKRIPWNTYKLQHRGGKGVRGMTTRDGDDLQQVLVADTHDVVLLFTNLGRVYALKCYDITADSSRTTRGTPLANLLPIPEKERVTAMVAVPDMSQEDYLVIATQKGEVKAVGLSELANIRSNGLAIMDLENGDQVVSARLAGQNQYVVMVTQNGQAIRYPLAQVPRRSRAAGGVRGMRLAKGDLVVAMELAGEQGYLLTVSRQGFGKSTPLSDYRGQGRGGVGVRTFRVTPKTGPVADAKVVPELDDWEVLLSSAKAQVIRVSLEDIKAMGRNTSGVIVWRDREPDDYITAVTCFCPNGPKPGVAAPEAKKTVHRQRGSTNGRKASA